MADYTKDIIVKVNLDTKGVETEVQQLNNTIAGVGSNVQPQAFVNIRKEIRQATLEAQNLGAQFGTNSKEFVNAAKRVAQLKDQFDETNKVLSAFNPDNKLQGLVGVAGGAVSAIQGVAGAFTLIGVNADTANESIAKLQGLMAITDSLNAVGDIKDSFTGLAGAIKGPVISAFTTLRGALSALGIGLLVTVISYLVANFDKVKKVVTDIFPGLNNLGGSFDKFKQIVIGVGGAVVNFLLTPLRTVVATFQQIANFFENGEFNFDKIAAEAKKGLDVVGNYNKAAGDERVAQQKEADKKTLESTIAWRENQLKIAKSLGKDVADIERANLKDSLALAKLKGEGIEEAETNLAVFENGLLKEKADKQKEANDKIVAENKKKIEELKKQEQEYQDFIKGIQESFANEFKSQQQIEIDEVNKKYAAQLEYAKKYNKDLLFLEESRLAEIDAINQRFGRENAVTRAQTNVTVAETALQQIPESDTFGRSRGTKDLFKARREEAKAQFEQDLIDAAGNREKQSLIEAQYSQKLLDLKRQEAEELKAIQQGVDDARSASIDKYIAKATAQISTITNTENQNAEERKRIAQDEREAKEAILEGVSASLTAASQLAGEQTIAGKALAVASATIDTYMAINKTLAATPAPAGIPLAIATGLFGLLQVKKILATPVPTKDGAGANGGSAPNISAPQLQTSVLNVPREAQNVRVVNPGQQTVRAYITNTDLKTNEERQNFLNKLSNF